MTLAGPMGRQDEEGLRRALERFGHPAASIERIVPLPRRMRNDNYRVRAAQRDWVLKRHTSPAAVERVGLAHPLESRLAAADFPVARIQRSTDGGTLVADGNAFYTLHTWVEGQQIAIADREWALIQYPELLGHLAATVGRLHRTSAALDRSGGGAMDPDLLLMSPRHTAKHLGRPRPRLPVLSRWHSLRLKPHKSEFDRWIVATFPDVVRRARRLADLSISGRVESSESIVIHNDINWENLIFDDDFQLLALLDFDNVVRAPHLLEAGSAAVVLVGAQRARVEAFLSAYEAASGLRTDQDVTVLAMKLRCVQSILNSMSAYLTGNAADLERIASWCLHLHEALEELDRW